jgi:DNA polymerase-3 subunit gamma/tau
MNYKVIARKYRPQNFEQLIGQRPIAETLSNAIKLNKISHAYLFAGPRGVGKTSTARILAKSLNCEKGPTITPCQTCKNCIEITNGNSLDVIEIDGASNRGIDEIRELKEKAAFTPTSGKYKIYIIDEVHMLTDYAFNALLKTLEEPPSHVIFILATTEPYKIPTTIISRCQRFDFKRIPIIEMVNHLKNIALSEKIKIDDKAIFLIAKNSDGSLRDALSTLDQLISFAEGEISEKDVQTLFGLPEYTIIENFIDAIIENNVEKGIKIIYQIYNIGIDLKQFVINLITTFRNIILVKEGIEDPNILEESEDKILIFKKFKEKMELEVLQEMVTYLTSVLNDFRFTSSFKILLEVAFLNLINISKKITLKFIYDAIKEFKNTQDIEENNIERFEQKEVKLNNFEKVKKNDFKENWNLVLSEIGKNSGWLPGLLKNAELKDSKIYISLPDSYTFSQVNNPNLKRSLEEIIYNIFGERYEIKVLLKNEVHNDDEIKIKKTAEIFNATVIRKE